MDKQSAVLGYLKEWFEEENYEPVIVETEEILILRVMVPLLENERGLVLMEIFMLEYSEITDLVHIFSTMTPESETGSDALREVINGWNLTAFAGAYGIYEEKGQLFHRHTVAAVTDMDPEDVAEAVLQGICVSVEEMERRFPEVIALSDPS